MAKDDYQRDYVYMKQQRDELLAALKKIAEMTYDGWTNGAIAGDIARIAIEQIEQAEQS